ncbi:MAG: hypothetical protein HND44_10840 [Chloroflexi bacterium]|nr:flippase-like domain-containing protein [Ardenticatenaceae bacterium]NOG35053.1 hypothetical protein [Chloroflexota bacterium]
MTRANIISTFSRVLAYFQSGWRRQAIPFLFFLLSVAVILSVLANNWQTLITYHWQVRPHWLLYAFIFMSFDLLLGAYAWHLLMTRLGPYNNRRHNFKFWLYANLARRLPGPVWHIASRAVLYEEKGISKTVTSMTSGLELAIILVSGAVTFFLVLPFWVIPDSVRSQLNQSWLLLIILLPCLLLVHPRSLNTIWQKLGHQSPNQRLYWHETMKWLLLYIPIWIIGGIVLYCVSNMFQPVPRMQFFPLIGMWVITNILSLAGTLTFTGMGLREISLTLLLALFMPPPVALLTVIVLRLTWLGGELGGALISLLL